MKKQYYILACCILSLAIPSLHAMDAWYNTDVSFGDPSASIRNSSATGSTDTQLQWLGLFAYKAKPDAQELSLFGNDLRALSEPLRNLMIRVAKENPGNPVVSYPNAPQVNGQYLLYRIKAKRGDGYHLQIGSESESSRSRVRGLRLMHLVLQAGHNAETEMVLCDSGNPEDDGSGYEIQEDGKTRLYS